MVSLSFSLISTLLWKLKYVDECRALPANCNLSVYCVFSDWWNLCQLFELSLVKNKIIVSSYKGILKTLFTEIYITVQCRFPKYTWNIPFKIIVFIIMNSLASFKNNQSISVYFVRSLKVSSSSSFFFPSTKNLRVT